MAIEKRPVSGGDHMYEGPMANKPVASSRYPGGGPAKTGVPQKGLAGGNIGGSMGALDKSGNVLPGTGPRRFKPSDGGSLGTGDKFRTDVSRPAVVGPGGQVPEYQNTPKEYLPGTGDGNRKMGLDQRNAKEISEKFTAVQAKKDATAKFVAKQKAAQDTAKKHTATYKKQLAEVKAAALDAKKKAAAGKAVGKATAPGQVKKEEFAKSAVPLKKAAAAKAGVSKPSAAKAAAKKAADAKPLLAKKAVVKKAPVKTVAPKKKAVVSKAKVLAKSKVVQAKKKSTFKESRMM